MSFHHQLKYQLPLWLIETIGSVEAMMGISTLIFISLFNLNLESDSLTLSSIKFLRSSVASLGFYVKFSLVFL